MSKLADPTVCPDCRAPLDAQTTCTGCGLRLQGPLVPRLWEHVVAADRLVEQLRASQVAVPVPAPAPLPTSPLHPRPVRPRRLPAASVPVVLLSLGALCLLVAAAVFVVVTWSLLGITGRSLVLLGVTGLVALVAVLATRRRLRGAAESLWVVVAGMLALDLAAARSAGLAGLETLSDRDALTLTGLVLLALGAGVSSWTRRLPVTALWGMQAVGALGAVVATGTGAWLADEPAVGTAVAVPLLLLVAWAVRRVPILAAAVGGVGGASWLVLVALGAERLDEPVSWATWWQDARGWPLVVAAAYAAAGAVLRTLPLLVRQLLAGAALAVAAVVAVAPVHEPDSLRQSLARSAILLVLALVVALVPDRAWRVPAGVLGAAGVVLLGGATLLAGVVGEPLPTGAPTWTHLVAAAAVAAALLVLPVLAPREWQAAARACAPLAGGTVAAAAVAVVVGSASTASLVLVALTLGLLAATWWTHRRSEATALAVGVVGGAGSAYVLGLGLLAASSWTSLALASTVVAAALALWCADAERRTRPGLVLAPAVLGASAVLLGALAARSWVAATGGPALVAALAVLVLAAAVALGADALARRPWTRKALELSSLLAALAAVGLVATDGERVLLLTLVGVVVAAVAVLRPDRTHAGWLAGGLAVLSGALGVVGVGVTHPELAAAPVAVLLLAVGLATGRSDRADSLAGAGLLHALVVLGALLAEPTAALEAVVASTALALLVGTSAWLQADARVRTAPVAIALAACAGLEVVLAWTTVAGAAERTTAVLLAVYAGALLVLARPVARHAQSRLVLEVAGALAALAALAATPAGTTQPVVLTIVGTAVALVAVTTPDRFWTGWLSAGILGAATLLRVVDDVRAPELYTLPAAVLLLAAGGWRLRRDPTCSSLQALGSGLTLALVPSLLLALDEPVSARGLLLGIAAAVVLGDGVVRRLSAPLAFGAATIALLALRQLGTAADVVPRWVTLGLLGVALLAVGITWEARLRDLRAARTYVAALR